MNERRPVDPDEPRRADDAVVTPSADATTDPVSWDRHQMETDDAGESPARDVDTTPKWNKGEMAEERQDHTRAPLPDDAELSQPSGGLSGHGSNPGGGERWAERDRGEPDRGT